MKHCSAIGLLVLLAACGGEPASYAELSRSGPAQVGIDGYSPVSYFTLGTPERGRAEHTVEHDGVIYWLTSAEQVGAFEANPERYVPAHGGWCSLMLSGSGQMTPANPESFKIVDGRLLLFWSGEFNGQPVDGGRNWESKFSDAAGERALLDKADTQWQRLLDGKARQKIVLFAPDDAERVSDARRAGAKKRFE